MPRKRTPIPPTTDSETTAAQETPTATEAATATIEPPATEVEAQEQTFVQRIMKERQATPDPFGIAGDYVAGVRLFESRDDRVMAIKFEEKPGQAVLDKLKDAGYRWNPRDKVWVNPIRPESARATRIDAERLYQEVRGMIRQEKGIETGPEIPF